MHVVLIACSKRKQVGGYQDYIPSGRLEQALSPESFEKLMNARTELVNSASKYLPIGPDIGIHGGHVAAQYLPAYQRYTGIVYDRGRVQDLYPGQSNVRLLIISALYGLLDGEDLIQEYDLVMKETISGQRLYTWWKRHNLGCIVEEYILACNPAIVHDLLPISYQNALHPWPTEGIRHLWKPLDCYGLGQGSSYRRGEYVEMLLSKQQYE
jgi:cytoplasmic iron level regulating protein YaaA (DUF328/UPF0246 family)